MMEVKYTITRKTRRRNAYNVCGEKLKVLISAFPDWTAMFSHCPFIMNMVKKILGYTSSLAGLLLLPAKFHKWLKPAALGLNKEKHLVENAFIYVCHSLSLLIVIDKTLVVDSL